MPRASFCQAVERAPFARAIDGSVFWWPAIETTHLLALTLLLGSITTFDVRLLGLGMRHVPVSRLGERFLPCTWSAFGLSLLTGSLLFISEAQSKYCFNSAFRIKVLLLLVGVAFRCWCGLA